MLIEDATGEDRISAFGAFELIDGFRHTNLEDPLAYGALLVFQGKTHCAA